MVDMDSALNTSVAADINMAMVRAQGSGSKTEARAEAISAASGTGMSLEQVEATAQDFEAVFLSEMMKPMFETVSTDGPFSGGQSEAVYRSLLIQEYGKKISGTGEIGLANHVKNEIIRLQAAAGHPVLGADGKPVETPETRAIQLVKESME